MEIDRRLSDETRLAARRTGRDQYVFVDFTGTNCQNCRLNERNVFSKQQVKDRLVETYGPNVLAEPKSGGFNTAAYVVPILLVVLLAGGAALLVPRWRRVIACSKSERGRGFSR